MHNLNYALSLLSFMMIAVTSSSAGQWTYDPATGYLTHDALPWVLRATATDIRLSVTAVEAQPDTPSILPLDDAIDGGYMIASIGEEDIVFWNCTQLSEVRIPTTVTRIGDHEFGSCFFLTNITVAASNPAFSSIDGVLFNKNADTLLSYPGGRKGVYSVPRGVYSIDNFAFSGCPLLKAVSLPAGVTNIGEAAFWNCGSLSNMQIPASVTHIGQEAFSACSGLMELIFQGGYPVCEEHVFYGTEFVTLYVSQTHVQDWELHLDSDSDTLESGAAYWQGLPIRILEKDFIPFITTEVLDIAGLSCEGGSTDRVYKVTIPAGAMRLRIQAWSLESGICNIYTRYSGVPSPAESDSQGSSFGLGMYWPVIVPWPQAGEWFILLSGAWAYNNLSLIVSYDMSKPFLSDSFTAPMDPLIKSALFDGIVYDEMGTVCGTVTLSAQMTARMSAGMPTTNWSFSAKTVLRSSTVRYSSKDWSGTAGHLTFPVTRSGERLDVWLGENTFCGTVSGGQAGGTLNVAGSRNVFADRNDSAAQARLAAVKGYYTMALLNTGGYSVRGHEASLGAGAAGYLTLTVGDLGTVKMAGRLADGTTVSCSAKLLEGLNSDGWYAIALYQPLYSRKGTVSGLLWLNPSDQVLRTDRYSGWYIDWFCGKEDTSFVYELDACGGFFGERNSRRDLSSAYAFYADVPEDLPHPVEVLSGSWVEFAFPWQLHVTRVNDRLLLPKATVPRRVGTGRAGYYDYDVENPSCATLSYQANKGFYKGSFKLYFDGVDAKTNLQHKTTLVPFAGVLTPCRDQIFSGWSVGLGTGTATINRRKIGIPVSLRE